MSKPVLLTTLTCAAVLSLGCGTAPPAPESPSPASESTEAARPGVVTLSDTALARTGLRTVRASRVDLTTAVAVNGRIELDADRTVRVASFVEGVVRECCKSVGSYVREGETLAVLHSHQTHELLAEYRQAQAELQARQAELDFAKEAHHRASRLHELKAGPLAEVQRTETALSRAEKAVLSARAAVAGAEAHFEFLGVEPPRGGAPGAEPEHLEIVIKSPRAGSVIERNITLGDVVNVTDQLYLLSDLSRVWVIAQVPEEQLSEVSTGMKVNVRVRAYPDRIFPGSVTRISSELDPDSRMAAVRCSVPNPRGVLKVGMYAQVELSSSETRSALTVPRESVQTVDEHPTVFVEQSKGRYGVRRVQPGNEYGDLVEILDGLREGETVVAHGSFLLKAESMRSELAEE